MGDKEQAFAWLAKAAAERNRFPLEIKFRRLRNSDFRFSDAERNRVISRC